MAVQFLKPSDLIKQIRAVVPAFADRVAGAAQYDRIEDVSKIALPACFVLLTDNVAETLSMQTRLDQTVYHGFDILLILDAVDLRKQEAEEIVVGFKALLLYALNGWLPEGADVSGSPLQFQGDVWRNTNPARYIRVFRFVQDYYWHSDEDGVGEDNGELGNFDKFIGEITHGTEGTLPVEITNLYQP